MFLNKYIADRKFYRELFIIATPIIIQYFIQHFITLLDNLMVGQLGAAEIAAVGVANQYYKLFYPAIVSICTGAAIYTAQYYGSKRQDELQKIFSFKIFFPLLITITFVVTGWIYAENIIKYFIKEKSNAAFDIYQARALGKDYLKLVIWSFIPLSFSTAFTFTFRPLKMTKIPMIASTTGMVTNVILNFFLIYGIGFFPALGVQGAAIGTIVARVLELGVHLYIFSKNKFVFKTTWYKYFIIDIKLSLQIFKKVIPLFINQVSFAFALVTIFYIYSDVAADAIVVVTISDIVRQVVYILVSGLGTSTSILVGYKLGQNKLKEAEENANYLLGYGVMMGFVILVIISFLAMIIPEFYNIDPSLKRMTMYAIIVHGLVAPFMLLSRIPFFVFRSGGRVYEILFIHSLFMWFVRVPTAAVFGYFFNLNIIQLIFIVESTRILNAIISMWLFKRKSWLHNITKD